MIFYFKILKSDKDVHDHFSLQAGSSSFQDEAEDVEEQPLIRNRSRSLGCTNSAKDVEVIETNTLSSTGHQDSSNNPQHNGNPIHSDEV